MKCEYCNTEHLRVQGNELICSRCGAPLKNVAVVPSAPMYAFKTARVLHPEAKQRLLEQWKEMHKGNAPMLMILERGDDLVPMLPPTERDVFLRKVFPEGWIDL